MEHLIMKKYLQFPTKSADNIDKTQNHKKIRMVWKMHIWKKEVIFAFTLRFTHCRMYQPKLFNLFYLVHYASFFNGSALAQQVELNWTPG